MDLRIQTLYASPTPILEDPILYYKYHFPVNCHCLTFIDNGKFSISHGMLWKVELLKYFLPASIQSFPFISAPLEVLTLLSNILQKTDDW